VPHSLFQKGGLSNDPAGHKGERKNLHRAAHNGVVKRWKL